MRYTNTTDKTLDFIIDAKDAGTRIDKYLATVVKDHSRSFLKKILDDDDFITVNEKNTKPSYKLKPEDKLHVKLPTLIEMSAEAENIPLDIIYEDESIIVINKQADFVIHPAPGHETGTLVNALLYHCKELSGIGEDEFRPGIVHRLDRDTTGCVICAKTDIAHRELAEQFASRTTEKTYITLTSGVPDPTEGKIEGFIARSHSDYKRMALYTAGGKYSLTYYKTIKNYSKFALVECDIKTGRTHQIRLHMKSVGSPVLCDRDYGREAEISEGELQGKKKSNKIILNRQALHAASLTIDHPVTGKRMNFTSDLPYDMKQAIKILEML